MSRSRSGVTRLVHLFEVVEELEGDRVTSVERRGKYLLVRLESGFALLVHLRMTGSFGFAPTSHERAVLELDDGSWLAYRDVRRFGTCSFSRMPSWSRIWRRRTASSRSDRASPRVGSQRSWPRDERR